MDTKLNNRKVVLNFYAPRIEREIAFLIFDIIINRAYRFVLKLISFKKTPEFYLKIFIVVNRLKKIGFAARNLLLPR